MTDQPALDRDDAEDPNRRPLVLLSRRRFSAKKDDPHRALYALAALVESEPLLSDAIPTDELADQTDLVERAEAMGREASHLHFEAIDPVALASRALENGETVDVAALVMEAAQNSAMADRHYEVRSGLVNLAERHRYELARLIEDSVPAMYAHLSDQLDSILDRAEAAQEALGGRLDAESAIAAGKSEDYRAFRAAADEYVRLRGAHFSLLRYEDDGIDRGMDVLSFAFHELAHDFALNHMRNTLRPTAKGEPKHPSDPYDFVDYKSLDHFRAVVRNRAAVKPRVATAAVARAARSQAVATLPQMYSTRRTN